MNKRLQILIENTGKGDFPLEKEIGLAQGSLKNWRNNKSKPSTDALIKLAEYFKVSIDYLLDRTDTPEQIDTLIKQFQSNKY